MSKLKKIKRNAEGLLTDVDYKFSEEGLIDWRKMIDNKWLVPNRQRTEETDVSKLNDYELIILLGGIKELAQIRGFTDVKYSVVSPSADYVVATCTISWIPNYETEGKEVSFSAIGDASPQNTSGFGQMFLAACAENRSFVRCVRNFLRINIVAQEELAKMVAGKSSYTPPTPAVEENQTSPSYLLKKVMKEKSITFESVKKKLVKEKFEGLEKIKGVDDIPKFKMFELIERIKTIK
tara:strand:+ start:1416 stop:2126 length:711 start_codon:yes stop_codon:yes gene_type:complete